MTQYIDKDALVAEIERKRRIEVTNNDVAYNGALDEIRYFLDSLEVKEVDLKKEIYDAEKRFGDIDEMGGYKILIFDDEFRDVLRHFFELGIKAKGE